MLSLLLPYVGWALVLGSVLFLLAGLVIQLLPSPQTPLFREAQDEREHVVSQNVVRDDDENIAEVFLRRVEASGERGAYYEKNGDQWVKTSWKEFGVRASKIAHGLCEELNVAPGSHISILGRTCGLWCELDVACHLSGCVSIGVYPNQSEHQYRYQLEHSDTQVLFVETKKDALKVLQSTNGVDCLQHIVPWTMGLYHELVSEMPDPRLVPISTFQEKELDLKERDMRLTKTRGEATAIIVYTSGVTGAAKGVMLTHNNLIAFATCRGEPFFPYDDDLTYSFLPMAHVAERCISFYARIAYGQTAAFCSNMRYLLKELDYVKPTIFGAVPRIFEKAHGRIYAEVGKRPWPLPAIFRGIMEVGIRRGRLLREGKPVPFYLKALHALVDHYVYSIVRRFFLGGRVQRFVTGAAPLSLTILEFFWALDLQIYEVYGMSEATGVTHANTERAWKLGTVGRALPSVETSIAEDGEILVRCPWVFKGYYKDEEKTAEALRDGWLCTGDIGVVEDGFLRITDRKKHIIITAGGKNLSPAQIEATIKNVDPIISHVVAVGDRRPFITALIALGPIETLEWGVQQGMMSEQVMKHHMRELIADPTARSAELERDMAEVTKNAAFAEHIKQIVAKGNENLMQVESVKAFIMLDRDLAVEHGEMTPTMKVRRKDVLKKWEDDFDRLYTDPSFGLRFAR